MLIPLTQGKVAVIDDADWPLVAGYRWWAVNWAKPGKPAQWYAAGRPTGQPYSKTYVAMHRLLTNAPKGMKVDHRDRNGLNNRRSNCRDATTSQNSGNTKRQGGVSGFKGVTVRYESGRFRFKAQIAVGNQKKHLGTYDTAEEAARAYDDEARRRWGEFARVNFPKDGEESVFCEERQLVGVV